jgi:enoyl-CoA hydratase/carnithine racemase
MPVPVIARVNGYCLGAGLEIAAGCDLRVAADTAVFGMPEVKVGIPSVIEAALLPRLVGWGRAAELVLTGETIDAAEALRIGLVEKVAPFSGLDAAVERWIAALLAAGPRAIRLQKQLMRDWERLPLEGAIAAGIATFRRTYQTDEPRRLMERFLNRRRLPG